MTIVQLARAAGETIHAVRYYARVGLISPADVGVNGYRHFDAGALRRLAFVRRAQRLGFTLQEVAGFMADAGRGRSPCPQVRQVLDDRLPQIASQFAEAAALLQRMQRAQRRWRRQPDGVPDGHAICRLIDGEPVTDPERRTARARAESNDRRTTDDA